MEDFLSYPLFLSLRGMTTSINETVQIMKNFTTTKYKSRYGNYQTWISMYNHLAYPNIYKQLVLPFKLEPEVIKDKKMRKVYNYNKDSYEKKGRRAGLLLFYRDVNQHINPKRHAKGQRASWEETMSSTMHLAIGAVTLDAWGFSKKHKQKRNITADVLDLSRDYTQLENET